MLLENQDVVQYKNIYQNISLEPEHEQSPSLENANRKTLKKYYDEIRYMYRRHQPLNDGLNTTIFELTNSD